MTSLSSYALTGLMSVLTALSPDDALAQYKPDSAAINPIQALMGDGYGDTVKRMREQAFEMGLATFDNPPLANAIKQTLADHYARFNGGEKNYDSVLKTDADSYDVYVSVQPYNIIVSATAHSDQSLNTILYDRSEQNPDILSTFLTNGIKPLNDTLQYNRYAHFAIKSLDHRIAADTGSDNNYAKRDETIVVRKDDTHNVLARCDYKADGSRSCGVSLTRSSMLGDAFVNVKELSENGVHQADIHVATKRPLLPGSGKSMAYFEAFIADVKNDVGMAGYGYVAPVVESFKKQFTP